jgi:hypothetical protein
LPHWPINFYAVPPLPNSARRPRSEKTINRHLIRAGARVASEIKRGDVIAMLEAIDAGSGPTMAAKALALASEIYRFGITRELGGLENSLPPHHRATSSAKWNRVSGF